MASFSNQDIVKPASINVYQQKDKLRSFNAIWSVVLFILRLSVMIMLYAYGFGCVLNYNLIK